MSRVNKRICRQSEVAGCEQIADVFNAFCERPPHILNAFMVVRYRVHWAGKNRKFCYVRKNVRHLFYDCAENFGLNLDFPVCLCKRSIDILNTPFMDISLFFSVNPHCPLWKTVPGNGFQSFNYKKFTHVISYHSICHNFLWRYNKCVQMIHI